MSNSIHENYKIYDALPCAAAVFYLNENLDIIYSNTAYKEIFGGDCIKMSSDDRAVFDVQIFNSQSFESFFVKLDTKNGKTADVCMQAKKIDDNTVCAIFFDESEHTEIIQRLSNKCARYTAAISSSDEAFFEYNSNTDELVIFLSADTELLELHKKDKFFATLDINDCLYDEDRDIIRALHSDVKRDDKTEKYFEVRLRISTHAPYEWYAVTTRPDKHRAGIFMGNARNINSEKAEEEKLKEKVLIDPLSKVYNRSAAIEKIEKQLNLRLEDCECALLVLDIDNFKRINDTYGHLYGDAVIAMAASCVKSTLDEDDIIGRFGGDEFFVFVDNADREELEKKLENIRTSVLQMRVDVTDDNDISCSIGVALGNGASTYEEMFRKADSALYKAKENGKNRFEYFDGVYSAEKGISYTARANEDESNAEHNTIAVALEIASKSRTPEQAVINLMRHIGMTINLDCIQIFKFDMIEDKVHLEFQWYKQRDDEYNIAITEKKMGYYPHSDLVFFRNQFEKSKIFKYEKRFSKNLSEKYYNTIKAIEDFDVFHTSNLESDTLFYAVVYQYWNNDRKWEQSELDEMFEIERILSMYLNSSNVETEREKMLMRRIDYINGLYSLPKFFEEGSKVTRDARENNEMLYVVDFDIQNLYKMNVTYGGDVGDKLLESLRNMLKKTDNKRAIACQLVGTDTYILLFRTSREITEIKTEILSAMESACAPFDNLTDPPFIIKAGMTYFKPGDHISDYVDGAHFVKKGIIFDKCDVLIADTVLSSHKNANWRKRMTE